MSPAAITLPFLRATHINHYNEFDYIKLTKQSALSYNAIMKILAIDYGAKRIGLAVSDKKNRIAFPFAIVENNTELIERLKTIIRQEEIEKIIVGAPKYNPKTELYYQIETFINNLKANFDLSVEIQDELLTSCAAQKIKFDATGKIKSDHDLAAMLILENYLNKS